MSLSLNDLGRAAWIAEWKALLGEGVRQPNFDSLSEVERRPTNLSALAAVERFAEEAIRASCRGCANSVRIDESGYHVAGPIEVFVCRSQPLKNLLSSLRDEAGQKGGAT